MNMEVFELDQPLEVEPSQVKQALRCLLHTILFNRALGSITPREVSLFCSALLFILLTCFVGYHHAQVECDIFEISYARVDDERIQSTVEKNIDKLIRPPSPCFPLPQ